MSTGRLHAWCLLENILLASSCDHNVKEKGSQELGHRNIISLSIDSPSSPFETLTKYSDTVSPNCRTH